MNKHIRENSCEIRPKFPENESIHNEMSEKVQILANKIYKEFERLISFYGSDVVEYLMPLIVNVLENLEESYRIKQIFEIDLELLKEDNLTLNRQYEKEKIYKKQAEERVLHIEYAYEEEKKLLEEKVLTLESLNRIFEVKTRNYSETITRLEEKIQSLKTENQKLYERYSEILKSHAEQLNRIKAEAYRDISPPQSLPLCKSDKFPIKSTIRESRLQTNHFSEGTPNKKSEAEYTNHSVNYSHGYFEALDRKRKSLTPDYISHDEETLADILSNDQWVADFSDCSIDNNNNQINQLGIINPAQSENNTSYFDDHQDISHPINGDHSLEINNIDSDTDVTDDEFGIGREIDSIIHENQELIATKNALNVVKDDLINRLDIMTNENDVLREDLRRHSNREADLKGKLSHLQFELKTCKEELNKVKESEDSKITSSIEKKSFSRTEMTILLEERNHFKEKLMELQDAVVYKEMCRVKKQFPEFKESSKPIKSNNSGIWNLFNHIFKKEEDSNMVFEKSRNLLSRFKRESDRSQLYSWSVPRSLIESELPKRIPIPIKIQPVFEQKDIVICTTPGNEELDQENNSAQYFWCLIQSNIKNNKNYYLQQMCLAGKVPELSNKYSINLQFPTIPISVAEVPALNVAAQHLHLLTVDNENKPINAEPLSTDQSEFNETERIKLSPTKLQMKNKVKHNLGSKTLWFACEKNQIVIYVLFDNNKIENRMAVLTMESEIDFIKYNFGRVFVVGKNGSLGIFELNKEMNLWEINQCLTIDVSGGLPISDSSCDTKRLRLWLGSSTNCYIMNLSTLNIVKSLSVMEDNCTSIESMIIIDKYSLMLISVSRIGLLIGYDLRDFQYKVSMDLKPSVFELIEPIQGIEKSTLSLFQLVVDGERIWMTTDCGMILVVTLDTIFAHMKTQSMKVNKSKFSLQTDKVYISSHAFAQCIKIISLLQYSNTTLCLENFNSLKRFTDKDMPAMNREDLFKKDLDEGELNTSVKTFSMMTAIGSSYVNLNCSVSDIIHRSNHAIIWKT